MSNWTTAGQQSVADTWNGYTDYQPPQEFMDVSRAKLGAACTIEQAVDSYLGNFAADEGPSADEVNDVRANLITYLERSRGSEWDIPADA